MYRKERKIPTLLALFLLLSGLGIAWYGDRTYQSFRSNAAPGTHPTDIHITDITDHSFAISWWTDAAVAGSLSLRGGGKTLQLVDDLDSDGIVRPRKVHQVTAKNLTPDTVYTIAIIGTKWCNGSTCPTLSQKTAAGAAHTTTLPPLRGTVKTQENTPADGTLVYVNAGKSLPLSARTDSAGLWIVQLSALRAQDLSDRLTIEDTDPIQITIKRSPAETASAVLDVKSLKNSPSLPPMIFGSSYNLTELTKERVEEVDQANKQTLGTHAQRIGAAASGLGLLFPKAEFDTTSDTKPRFRGTATPNTTIRISLDANAQGGTISVGRDGTWSSRPSAALVPGTHRVTIQGVDKQGKPVSLSRQFIVMKSGEQVLGDATPSGTLTPTVTPPTIQTPTATIVPGVPTPTSVVTPTIDITMTPTMTPTLTLTPTVAILPTTTAMPTIAGEIPPLGSVTPTFMMVGTSVGLLVLAAILLTL